jgi:uncharacterized lipoprotein YajG
MTDMQIEKLNYGAECIDLDFGIMNARNQLISKVINPLLDMILAKIKADRVVGAEYKVSIVVTSTRDIDTVQ